MYLLATFILQFFFKKILELIQSYEDKHHFQEQNGSFFLNKNFLAQAVVITFIYLLALFIVQNLKKFLQQIQNYEDVQFLDPIWPISPNENFFRKPVNESRFSYSCLLHAKNQSQILIYE